MKPHAKISNEFNELFQRFLKYYPIWKIRINGPIHEGQYTATIKIPGTDLRYLGRGRGKKKAKSNAALMALNEKEKWAKHE